MYLIVYDKGDVINDQPLLLGRLYYNTFPKSAPIGQTTQKLGLKIIEDRTSANNVLHAFRTSTSYAHHVP